jgi:hypothetical protein
MGALDTINAPYARDTALNNGILHLPCPARNKLEAQAGHLLAPT